MGSVVIQPDGTYVEPDGTVKKPTVVRNHTTGQILCAPSCPIQHIKIPTKNSIKEPKNGWPDIRGLNSLQVSRTTLVNRAAIERSMVAYSKGLPRELQERLQIETSGFSNLFNPGNAGDASFDIALARNYDRFTRAIRAKEYTVWPVNIGNYHWVTLVIHKQKRAGQSSTDWGHIAQVGYYDPLRDVNANLRRRMVYRRLQIFLTRVAKFTFAEDWRRDVWIPVQRDATSCGPRCYWVAKQFMDRLLELYEANRNYHENLWNPHSGWFNNEFVRSEMVGRVAWEAVEGMDYNARVAVELVNYVEDDSGVNKVAADLMKPADYGVNIADWPKPIQRPVIVPLPKAQPLGSTNSGAPTVDEMLPPPVPHQPKIAPDFSAKDHSYTTLEASEPPQTNEPVWPPGPKTGNPWIPPAAYPSPASNPKPKPPQPQPGALFSILKAGKMNLFENYDPSWSTSFVN
ncbi:hypothetical protein F5X99DRAFT_172806 [Biscogniauxia marginata]|nr:hypothetical protein F5X99DRAFT_172806 [Biscogniauxia marginata]